MTLKKQKKEKRSDSSKTRYFCETCKNFFMVKHDDMHIRCYWCRSMDLRPSTAIEDMQLNRKKHSQK